MELDESLFDFEEERRKAQERANDQVISDMIKEREKGSLGDKIESEELKYQRYIKAMENGARLTTQRGSNFISKSEDSNGIMVSDRVAEYLLANLKLKEIRSNSTLGTCDYVLDKTTLKEDQKIWKWTIEQAQAEVDDAINKFGRIGGGLYDELDHHGFYVDSNNKVQLKVPAKKKLKENYNNEFTIEINNEIYCDDNGEAYHFDSYVDAQEFIEENELENAFIIRQHGKAKYEEVLTEDNSDTRIVKTGLKEDSYEVLSSVIGQMSDGIWENTPSMEKYWANADINKVDGQVVITVSNNWSSPYRNMSDLEVCQYFARKIKQIIKIEIEDGSRIEWKRNSDEYSDYLDATVGEAYKIYDALLGRIDRSAQLINDSRNPIKIIASITKYLKSKGLKLNVTSIDDGVSIELKDAPVKDHHLVDEAIEKTLDKYGIKYSLEEKFTGRNRYTDGYSSIHLYHFDDFTWNQTFESLLNQEELTETINLNEDLNQEELSDNGLATVINTLIKDEWDAIQAYNDAIVTFETEGKNDLIQVLQDILNEENLHVGQLETLLEQVSGSANSIDAGKAEAEVQLIQNESTENTIEDEEDPEEGMHY